MTKEKPIPTGSHVHLQANTEIRPHGKVFSPLPEKVMITRKANKKERFLEALPGKFNRQDYLAIAGELKIADRTALHYVTQFVKAGLVLKSEYNHYVNSTKEEELKLDGDQYIVTGT